MPFSMPQRRGVGSTLRHDQTLLGADGDADVIVV
jgi:hypothetical protein